MRKALVAVEWLLLIVVGGLALLLVLPIFDLFDRDEELSAAKKKGHYYEVKADKQTYFNKKISLDGVVYGDGKLIIYMTSKGLFRYHNLPNNIQVKTDTNEVLDYQSSGSSNNIYKSSGAFNFNDVPAGIKSITVFKEAYGESFSFQVSLEGGKTN
ncbi:hypothetical protein [Paenibacillus sp. PL91]|uniref:hypothetical protein n=1 Tax=Paenibacillus sp. PL91 TaxID=2729538 RepID=UPI00145DE06F|nr:hypothetical protein [Paenibacillus sp. PL91]MBC9202090.1 hypothetical protein [Paenibacillus sp. PL91]